MCYKWATISHNLANEVFFFCQSLCLEVSAQTVIWDIYISTFMLSGWVFNPLNPELNPICYLLALLGAHHFLHVSRIMVKSLTLRLLMSYIHIWSAYS